MPPYTALRTLTGGDVIETQSGRAVDVARSFEEAEARAAELNDLVKGMRIDARTRAMGRLAEQAFVS